MTQQCFFRLHNTIQEADEAIKVKILNDFMNDLYLSGYDEKDRKSILEGGINTYLNLKEKEIKGTRPFYRTSKFEKYQRKSQKDKKRTNWFEGKNCDNKFKSVIYVDATPGDSLLRMMKETEEKFRISDDIRITIVSKSGYRLSSLVQNKNPARRNCGEKNCNLCEYVAKSGNAINPLLKS